MNEKFIQVKLTRELHSRLRGFASTLQTSIASGRVDAPVHVQGRVTLETAISVLLQREESRKARNERAKKK